MKNNAMIFVAAVLAAGMSGCNDNKSTTTKVKKEVKVDEHGNETVKTETRTETKTVNTPREGDTVREEKVIIKEKDKDENIIKLGPLEVKK